MERYAEQLKRDKKRLQSTVAILSKLGTDDGREYVVHGNS